MSDPNDNEDFTPVPMTADVYRCANCGYIDRCSIRNDKATCLECGSQQVNVYVRAPNRSELAMLRTHNMSTSELKDHLDEIDPDWRERFHGDADLARDFYK